MLKYPERGPSVKTLSFYVKLPAIFDFMDRYERHFGDIPQAIALCNNITDLEVLDLASSPEAETFSFYFRHYREHPFSRLQFFKNTGFALSQLNPGFQMAKFLEATPSITSLSLSPHGWQGLPKWDASMLPHLTTFSGSARVVKLLAQSHPIRPLAHVEVYCTAMDYHDGAPGDAHLSTNTIISLGPFEGSLRSLQLHRDSDSEASVIGSANTGLFDLVYRTAYQFPDLEYLSVLDSAAKVRYVLPQFRFWGSQI